MSSPAAGPIRPANETSGQTPHERQDGVAHVPDSSTSRADRHPIPVRVHLDDFPDVDRGLFAPERPLRIDVTDGSAVVPLLVIPRTGAEHLIVLCNGAVDLQKSDGQPIFQRSSWWKRISSHQIFVCDPGTVGDEALSLNWFQAPEREWPVALAARAINNIAEALGVPGARQRTYFGSSAGGFTAIQLQAYAPLARSIVNNAQFDWTRWYAPAVKSVLKARYPGKNAAQIRGTWPRRANALYSFLVRQSAPHVDYWYNAASAYDREVQLPILQAFIAEYPRAGKNIRIHAYHDFDAGHNPMSADRTLELLESTDRGVMPAPSKGIAMSAHELVVREPFAESGDHDFYKVPIRLHGQVADAFADRDPHIVAVPIPDGPHLQAYGRVHPSKVLRVVFHGAVQAGKDQYPRFDRISTMLRTNDSFLSIADPTLTVDPELRLTWYAGTTAWDPAPVIDELIGHAAQLSGAEEIWLIGGSGGGLAAMRHGRVIDNALVFVFSPQTDASKYKGAPFPSLMNKCFDGMDADSAKARYPGKFEVLSAYSEHSTSTVYYMQNLTDPQHITDHYLPFLQAVGINEASGDAPGRRIRTALVAQERQGHGAPTAQEFTEHLTRAVQYFNASEGAALVGDAVQVPHDGPEVLAHHEVLADLSAKLTQAIDTTNRTYRALNRQIGLLPWANETYHRLSQTLVPLGRPLPPAGSFALRTAGIEELTRLVSSAAIDTIVECGSGSSTVWMAAQMEQLQRDGHVYALEHDTHYAQQTRDLLERSGLGHRATVVDAPIETFVGAEGSTAVWYSQEALSEIPEKIDLLFVDGPPASVGRRVREHALSALDARLRHGSLIAVDDIARPDEAAMVRAWLTRPELSAVPGFSELAVLKKTTTKGGTND